MYPLKSRGQGSPQNTNTTNIAKVGIICLDDKLEYNLVDLGFSNLANATHWLLVVDFITFATNSVIKAAGNRAT